jgi:ABC-2 type transport system permease protein
MPKRSGGLDIVWPQFLALAAIGATFFSVANACFRSTIGTMA